MKNHHAPVNVEDLAEQALNAACQTIQAALGVTDGGLASRHFSSDITRADLEEYIRLELLNKRMEAQDRAEASIVASLRGFKAAAYWSAETLAEDSSYAWYQYFDYGGQSTDLKSAELRAVAVRRVFV